MPGLFLGLVIEEIEEEETISIQPESRKSSSAEYSVSEPVDVGESSQKGGTYPYVSSGDVENLKSFRKDPEAMR